MRAFSYATITAILMLLGSLLPLSAALIGQYRFDLPPCDLCLLQRYPYIAVALCGILILWLKPRGDVLRLLIAVALLSWLTTAGIGLFHTGVEQGWIAYRGGCVANTELAKTIEDLRAQVLGSPKVSCADATASFLGLTLASWNALTALLWAVLLLAVMRRRAGANA